jgi:hypothetical protein
MNQYSEKYVDQLEVQIAEQQAEIEALRKANDGFAKSFIANEPIEEPVAWLELWKGKPNNVGLTLDWFDTDYSIVDYERVPLYTKPQNLTLSDEDVDEYYEKTYSTYAQYEGFVDGVEWALKKASEK